jgi:hypothetical protein
MLRYYKDIIDRCGEPKWYDGNGVPRYIDFDPDQCGVYDRYVAYLEIACQSCDERFFVAVEVDSMEAVATHFRLPIKPTESKIEKVERKLDGHPTLSPWEQIGSFHFGDPPRHGNFDKEVEERCAAGDTMNSVPKRIIEFWRLVSEPLSEYGWKRMPEYEFEIIYEKEEE